MRKITAKRIAANSRPAERVATIIRIQGQLPGQSAVFVSGIAYGIVETSPRRMEAWVFWSRQEAQATFDRNVGVFAAGMGQVNFEHIEA